MNYKILSEDRNKGLIERLLDIRNIDSSIEDFIDPKFINSWIDPFLINDMSKAVDRIIIAIKNKEKIMIFGDYDVDGITSSYILYSFLKDFLKYHFISIMYPNRKTDGYGIKHKHIDMMKQKEINLIITVDNGITSIQEADYCKEIGIDLIITDHHHQLDIIPQAFAVVNPQISDNYSFKGLAGVGVAFKLINAILSKTSFSTDKKNSIFNYFLPIVAIGTVADIVPLVQENRVIVKKGLDIMNYNRNIIPPSLKGMLEFLKLEKVDTFHIGFVIGPRINAGGRIQSPYDSLYTFLYSGEKQIKYLTKIDDINTERKKLQEKAYNKAKEMICVDDLMIIAHDSEFHEGIIGIVSGRLTEQFYKPSMIMSENQEEGIAVASLRGPEYFSIIDMLKSAENLLERFGGHKCAGGLTVKLDNLEKLKEHFQQYCKKNIKKTDLEKSLIVDTVISQDEWNYETLSQIDKLAPFGQGNPEPVFLISEIKIEKIEKIGKNGNGHIKIFGEFGNKKIVSMFWSKGADIEEFQNYKKVNIIGKIKPDNFNGGFFVDGINIFEI